MVFCFVQKKNFGQHESSNIYFFCRGKFNIRLYDKNSESDYFFFPPPKSEYFFQQHWESEYYFRKKTYPPSGTTKQRPVETGGLILVYMYIK